MKKCVDTDSAERGATTVEFAFAITLVLMLMIAIINFGQALYAYHWVSYAADDAARWASVRGSSCTILAGGCPAAATDIYTYVKGLLPPGLVASNVTVDTVSTDVWPRQLGNGNTPCSNDAAPFNYPGCVVQVKVSYSFAFNIPFLAKQVATANLSSTSQMVITQ